MATANYRNTFDLMALVADKYILETIPTKKAWLKRRKKLWSYEKMWFTAVSGVAATILFFFILWFNAAYPTLAKNLPVIGGVFAFIQDKLEFNANYHKYASEIGTASKSNGVSITMSEAYCDGTNLFLSYKIESDTAFKDYEGDLFSLQQIASDSVYLMEYDGKTEVLHEFGVSGLEGRFIDGNTFAGVESFSLFDTSYPDVFDLDVTFFSLGLYENQNLSGYRISGNWKFHVPVRVNREDIITYEPDISSNDHAIDKVIVSPVMITVYISYPDIYADNLNLLIDVYSDPGNEPVSVMGQLDRTNGVILIPRNSIGNVLEIFICDKTDLTEDGKLITTRENIERHALLYAEINLQ